MGDLVIIFWAGVIESPGETLVSNSAAGRWLWRWVSATWRAWALGREGGGDKRCLNFSRKGDSLLSIVFFFTPFYPPALCY